MRSSKRQVKNWKTPQTRCEASSKKKKVEFLHGPKRVACCATTSLFSVQGPSMYPSPQVRPDQLVVTDWDFRGFFFLKKKKQREHLDRGDLHRQRKTVTEHTVIKYRKSAREHKSKGAKEKVAQPNNQTEHVQGKPPSS